MRCSIMESVVDIGIPLWTSYHPPPDARDVNGDGRLDLVVSGGQSVIVLTGQGDGRFDVTWSGAADGFAGDQAPAC